MFKEFAIEPRLMAEWESFRELRDKFGIFQGRFIADFPRKRWKKLVGAMLEDQAQREHPVKNATTILEWLQSKDGRRDTRFSRQSSCYNYNETKEWLANAEAADDSFDALITTAESHSAKGITWDETKSISEHPLFMVDTQPRISRRGPELMRVIKPLLRFSTHIRWVDRYLFPEGNKLDTVVECLEWIRQDKIPIKRFEIHLGDQPLDPGRLIANFRRTLANSIPQGLEVSLHWWNDSFKENTHPRFVLADVGGLHFDHGTDPGHGTSIVHLLNRTRWHEEFHRYHVATSDLEACGSIVL